MHAHRVVLAALAFTLAACAAPAARVAAVGVPPSSSAPPAAVATLPSTPTTGPPATDLVVPAAPAAPEPVQAQAAEPPAAAELPPAAEPGGLPCGGDLPPCWVLDRESGYNDGDPWTYDVHAYNPTGCGGRGCYGKWQFDPRTGDGTGTEAEQDAEARRVWAGGAGCSAWAACS